MVYRRVLVLLAAIVLVCQVGAQPSPGAEQLAAAEPIKNFTLADFRGQRWILSDAADKPVVVVAFLGTECPLAKLYAVRLEKLHAEYAARGVTLVGIDANSQDSVSELAAFARQHAITFPLLKDLGNRVADQFGAQRTPEVFVLDGERVVRYRGRIDDQYGVGYAREKPQREDLRIALDELLAGKSVSQPQTQAVGCHVGRSHQPTARPTVTYTGQIAALFAKRCVECHRQGDIAPFALSSYDEAAGWAETIAEVVDQGRMPPWHADARYGKFQGDRRLSDEERRLVRQWAREGAPRGEEPEPTMPAAAVAGWQLPRQPDLVVQMLEPFRVPPLGEVKYRYFSVDPKLTADKWIAAMEVQPGNRAVVHHALVFARQPGNSRGDDEGGVRGFLAAYVPGLRPLPFPSGMAKHVAAGSQLVFQLHYTPNGSEQLDQTRIGFVFADADGVQHEVKTTSAVQRRLEIPPGAANHPHEATSPPAPAEALLLGMMPHMHLRGKAFSYEARFADGRSEMLLDVPHYDFNWQTSYRLVEPKPLAAGTRLQCVAHYDNSAENLNNPDPTQTVHWGDQTWEEMLVGYFDIAVPRAAVEAQRKAPAVAAAAGAENANDPASRRAAEVMARFDLDQDGVIARSEVPQSLDALFTLIDVDRSQTVTLAELRQAEERRRAAEAARSK